MGTSFSSYLKNTTFTQHSLSFLDKDSRVFVENETDIPFWKCILGDRCKITVYSYNINEQSRAVCGKGKLLTLECNDVQRIAIDADYDYLCMNNCTNAKKLNEPYIIHTFAYGRESIIYSPTYLEFLLQKMFFSHELDIYFDFKEFMELYSYLCYDVFIYFLYLLEYKLLDKVNISIFDMSILNYLCVKRNIQNNFKYFFTFRHILNIKELIDNDFNLNKAGFDRIELHVKEFYDKLHQTVGIDLKDLNQFKQEMKEKGLTPNNVCYFINSHIFEDEIIKPILTRLYGLIKIRELERVRDKYPTQKESKSKEVIKHYESKGNLDTLIHSTYTDFLRHDTQNELFMRIKQSITSSP